VCWPIAEKYVLQPHKGSSETMPDFGGTNALSQGSNKWFPSTLDSPPAPGGSTTVRSEEATVLGWVFAEHGPVDQTVGG
jgi:hypothetical protein